MDRDTFMPTYPNGFIKNNNTNEEHGPFIVEDLGNQMFVRNTGSLQVKEGDTLLIKHSKGPIETFIIDCARFNDNHTYNDAGHGWHIFPKEPNSQLPIQPEQNPNINIGGNVNLMQIGNNNSAKITSSVEHTIPKPVSEKYSDEERQGQESRIEKLLKHPLIPPFLSTFLSKILL